jgi:uncharacterized protein with NRDE domain
MCTLALYFKVFRGYSMVVAANRDEHYDRPSCPPSITGVDPMILAGKDLRAGGTWLGVNDYGLLVGILNRRQKPGAMLHNNYRSRGLLCLELLRLKQVDDLDRVFTVITTKGYQPFTVIGVDTESACLAYNNDQRIERMTLADGLHVFTNSFEFESPSKKTHCAYEAFYKLSQPGDRPLDVQDFVTRAARVLADHTTDDHSNDPREAICVHGDLSGTVSSSIIVFSDSDRQFLTYYCAGPPCQNSFQPYPRFDVR